MANCRTRTSGYSAAVVLEVADGCPDVKPEESEWMALAAGTSKGSTSTRTRLPLMRMMARLCRDHHHQQ
jgi:hypothetical protein